MLSAMWNDQKRLLLIGLAAALVLVYVAVHGLWGGGGAEGTAGANSSAPGNDEGGDVAVAPSGGQPGAAARADTAARRREIVLLAVQKKPENLPKLKEAAADEQWKVRHAAVDGVGRLGRKGDPQFLIEVLNNAGEKAEVRAAAADRLGAMHYWDAGPAIIDAMEDHSELLRARAGAALRTIIVVDLGFRADDPPGKRQEIIQKARRLWPWFHERFSKQAKAGG